MKPRLAYKKFWKLSFQLDGTTCRADYACAIGIQTLVTLALSLVTLLLVNWVTQGALDPNNQSVIASSIISLFFVYPSFIPMLAMLTRRTRDAGLPSGLVMLSLIPLLGYLWMLILFFLPSK